VVVIMAGPVAEALLVDVDVIRRDGEIDHDVLRLVRDVRAAGPADLDSCRAALGL
jgi:hypothetical protein